LVAKPEAIKEPDNLIKLWVHESERIYGDRLVSADNLTTYKALVADIVKKQFAKYNLSKYFTSNPEPLVFAQFVSGLEEKLYDQFSSID
jgi:dynein heavy chain